MRFEGIENCELKGSGQRRGEGGHHNNNNSNNKHNNQSITVTINQSIKTKAQTKEERKKEKEQKKAVFVVCCCVCFLQKKFSNVLKKLSSMFLDESAFDMDDDYPPSRSTYTSRQINSNIPSLF